MRGLTCCTSSLQMVSVLGFDVCGICRLLHLNDGFPSHLPQHEQLEMVVPLYDHLLGCLLDVLLQYRRWDEGAILCVCTPDYLKLCWCLAGVRMHCHTDC